MPKTSVERSREGRWTKTIDEYRRRHRTWVMQCMPSMSEPEWDLYVRWVANFGALRINHASRNSRKTRRQLKEARRNGVVTAPVTGMNVNQNLATKHTRMHFAMGMPYGIDKSGFTKAVRAAGAAKPKGRATRQK